MSKAKSPLREISPTALKPNAEIEYYRSKNGTHLHQDLLESLGILKSK